METLDSPVRLKYNNGNVFPRGFVIIAYIAIFISLISILSGSYIIGGIVILFSLLAITNRQIVIIDEDRHIVYEYVSYLGFMKMGNKLSLDKYIYITTVPLIRSHKAYAMSSTSHSSTISNNCFVVTLFGERLKEKCEITRYNSKNEAVETATQLGERLGIKYFEYDPKLVRQLLLGEHTI